MRKNRRCRVYAQRSLFKKKESVENQSFEAGFRDSIVFEVGFEDLVVNEVNNGDSVVSKVGFNHHRSRFKENT